MVNRIASGRVAQAPSAFNPLSIARAGNAATQIAQSVGAAVQTQAKDKQRFEQRDANVNTAIENIKLDAAMSEDIAEFSQGLPENGEGYSDAAMSAWSKRKAEALARANGDPIKIGQLTQKFKLDDAEQKAVFDKQERSLKDAYERRQTMLALDDAKQAVGRGTYAPPAAQHDHEAHASRVSVSQRPLKSKLPNAGRGVSKSAANALSRLESLSGRTFKVNSAFRDPAHNKRAGGAKKSQHMHGNAFDIDVSGMSRAERIELIKQARSVGFMGVGVYSNSLHFDVGGDRAWGGDYTRKTLPSWAADAVRSPVGVAVSDSGVDEYGVPVYTGERVDLRNNPAIKDTRNNLHALIDARAIPSWQKAEMKRAIDAELYGSAMDTLVMQNPAAALDLVRSGELDSVLTYKQTESYEAAGLRDVEAIRKQAEIQIAAEAKAQEKIEVEDARQKANDFLAYQGNGRQGEPVTLSQGEIDRLTPAMQDKVRLAPQVADAQALAATADVSDLAGIRETLLPSGEGSADETAVLKAFDEVADNRAKRAVSEALVDASNAAGVPPPMDAEGVKDVVNERFAGVETIGEAVQFAADNSVVPDGLKQMVSQMIGADDPQTQAAAVEAVGRLNAAKPKMMADASQNPAMKRALAASVMVTELGLSPQEALKRTDDMNNPGTKPDRDRNRAFWRSDTKANSEAAWELFQDKLKERGEGQGLSGREAEAAIPAGVWETYSDIVEDEFALTGNMNVAVAMAEKAFYRTHAVSHIGGQAVWQRGSPEAAYPFYEDSAEQSAWIEQQALMHVDGAKSVRLIPQGDPLREREPTYMVIATMGDGSEVLADAPFKPDVNLQIAAAREDGRAGSENTAVVADAGRKIEVLIMDQQRAQIELYQHEQSYPLGGSMGDHSDWVEERERIEAVLEASADMARAAIAAEKERAAESVKRVMERSGGRVVDDVQAVRDRAQSDVGLGAGPDPDADLMNFLKDPNG